MTDLSLKAQKVFAAIESQDGESDLAVAIAALRAVADQVAPEQKPWHRTSDASAAKHQVRCELLAIAAELEATS